MSSSRTGSTYEASMREQYTHEADDRHQLEDERVHAALAAAVMQLNKLRRHLLKLGGRTSFRALFDAVMGDMPTLSGTLKTARRLGVVKFEGEHLLQGRDDAVVIELLDHRPAEDEVEYETKVSQKGSQASHEITDPFAIDEKTHTTAPCARCKKDVLVQDRVGVAGLVLHKRCFECYLDTCTLQLTPGRYASLEVDGELRFYCVAHFAQLFKRHGDYKVGFEGAPVKVVAHANDDDNHESHDVAATHAE